MSTPPYTPTPTYAQSPTAYFSPNGLPIPPSVAHTLSGGSGPAPAALGDVVFLGNLPQDAVQDELRALVRAHCPDLLSLSLCTNARFVPYAFATFSAVSEQHLVALNNVMYRGAPMRAAPARTHQRTLKLTGLRNDLASLPLDESDIAFVGSFFGPVSGVVLDRRSATAYLQFAPGASAKIAMAALRSARFRGYGIAWAAAAEEAAAFGTPSSSGSGSPGSSPTSSDATHALARRQVFVGGLNPDRTTHENLGAFFESRVGPVVTVTLINRASESHVNSQPPADQQPREEEQVKEAPNAAAADVSEVEGGTGKDAEGERCDDANNEGEGDDNDDDGEDDKQSGKQVGSAKGSGKQQQAKKKGGGAKEDGGEEKAVSQPPRRLRKANAFGFVSFSTERDATLAISKCNGVLWNQRHIRVQRCESVREKESRGSRWSAQRGGATPPSTPPTPVRASLANQQQQGQQGGIVPGSATLQPAQGTMPASQHLFQPTAPVYYSLPGHYHAYGTPPGSPSMHQHQYGHPHQAGAYGMAHYSPQQATPYPSAMHAVSYYHHAQAQADPTTDS